MIEVNYYIFLFFGVLFFAFMLNVNNRLKRTQEEKVDAELAYLSAQVHRHFLFNTLNTIYCLTLQKSELASNAIVKLATIMRYVLHEANQERVSLGQEIQYIEDYIELQKLCFGNRITTEFAVSGETEGKTIAPLILIPFIENAFKHGVNTGEDSRISVRIDVPGNNVILKVYNHKVSVGDEEQSGIGLQNLHNRLHLLYPSKHQLITEATKNYFSVLLHIWLT